MELPSGIRSASTILVVDDDEAVLKVICLLLNEFGYATIPCSNAEEALLKLDVSPVDAVITDIKMPRVTGIELLEKIHALLPDIPVILMTAYADLDTAVDAIKKGAFDFIIKPYKQEQLMHSVEKALRYRELIEMEQDYRRILEEFNREIETLISERTMNLMALTVADRVRNPATIIGRLSRKMLESRDLPDSFRAGLLDINEEVCRLEKIVSDFQAALHERAAFFVHEDLNSVVSAAISIISEKEIVRRGIVLNVALSAVPLKINMQKDLLRIAIFHLLGNAIEASVAGQAISISTMQENDKVFLVIADTGSGMAPEMLDNIFEPFFSTKAHSFGMGLPLVKQIVTEHLGEIKVKSEPGKGTSFILSFPLRWKQDPAAGIARETAK